jgi:hypothetical protein
MTQPEGKQDSQSDRLAGLSLLCNIRAHLSIQGLFPSPATPIIALAQDEPVRIGQPRIVTEAQACPYMHRLQDIAAEAEGKAKRRPA